MSGRSSRRSGRRSGRRSLGEATPRSAGAILARSLPVWLVLVGLALASCALAYLPMGRWNMAVSLGIAAAKMLLIGLFFMHLRRPDPLLRLAGGAWLLWVGFLAALVFADQATRAPLTQPEHMEDRTMAPPETAGGRSGF